MGPGSFEGVPSVVVFRRVFFFTRVSEKTTENSDRLGRKVRPGVEPSISRLQVLKAEPLVHWLGPPGT